MCRSLEKRRWPKVEAVHSQFLLLRKRMTSFTNGEEWAVIAVAAVVLVRAKLYCVKPVCSWIKSYSNNCDTHRGKIVKWYRMERASVLLIHLIVYRLQQLVEPKPFSVPTHTVPSSSSILRPAQLVLQTSSNPVPRIPAPRPMPVKEPRIQPKIPNPPSIKYIKWE